MKFNQIALLGAASLAVAQPHDHLHRHAKRGSHLHGRDAATTTTVAGPVVTVYELNGATITWDDVEEGIKNGKYVLVGDRISTVIEASSTKSSSSTPSPTSTKQAAQFIEEKKPTPSEAPPVPAPTPEPAKSSESAPAPASNAVADHSTSKGQGVSREFPSGEIDCSDFPSAYGPIAAEWIGLDGWTGVQRAPHYDIGAAAISYLENAISGQGGCTKKSFCSYNCPDGYQKSQWPKAQGSTRQSVGGLYCNANGKLELSRPEVSQLCTPGVGGVQAKNKLSKNVAVCRTDYPGTEGETIATNVAPGATAEITCPDAKDYYTWGGDPTSAQYYINPSGVSIEDGCQWGTAGSNMGNWAPVNMGVGRGLAGMTFISLFPNHPTNPDGVLDFNIKITGDISGDCKYEGGTYWSNGVENPKGCTVSVQGQATYEFY